MFETDCDSAQTDLSNHYAGTKTTATATHDWFNDKHNSLDYSPSKNHPFREQEEKKLHCTQPWGLFTDSFFKENCILLFSGTLSKKFLPRLLKPHSPCPGAVFEAKSFFQKRHSFIFFFHGSERKLFVKFFRSRDWHFRDDLWLKLCCWEKPPVLNFSWTLAGKRLLVLAPDKILWDLFNS